MSAAAWELLDLVARWVHVLAAIMWVGNSMLFNWLDRSLRPAEGLAQTPKPLGKIWLLHSGGFYYVEKTLLEGVELPRPLHWFKWQAYTTWLSGVVLLVAVYYVGGRAAVADPTVHAISHRHATAMAVAGLVVGWALYEGMQRLVAPRAPRLAVALWLAGLALVSFAFVNHLSGRAAFLHVGAMLATIMAGNVFFTIVPSQRELVASIAEGRGADPRVSARAKRVSIHNNYFTFPVVVLMASSHFPAVYGHRWSWLLLLVLIVGGAGTRFVLNQRWRWPRWKPALALVIGGTVAALALLLSSRIAHGPTSASAAAPTGPVTFADARHVIDRRCGACHSAHPSDDTYAVAPAGVTFDTEAEIVAHAARIRDRAVTTRTMPPGNKTRITDEERALLGRWMP